MKWIILALSVLTISSALPNRGKFNVETIFDYNRLIVISTIVLSIEISKNLTTLGYAMYGFVLPR